MLNLRQIATRKSHGKTSIFTRLLKEKEKNMGWKAVEIISREIVEEFGGKIE